nr:MAG TPA: hypothetical protein [Caudoviricetes sp.]
MGVRRGPSFGIRKDKIRVFPPHFFNKKIYI